DAFYRDRFDQYPGFLTYLKKQRDGKFWRKNSLRWQYDKIRVPAYLIGGLLDGYKDSVPRMLENMRVPTMAVMGPWNHSYPDDGEPGPNYEWKHEAVRWWDYWLKDRDTGIMEEPRFTVFIREGHPPDAELKMTPGNWVAEDWPIPGTKWKTFFPAENRLLQTSLGKPTEEMLRYVPSSGIATSGLTWDAQVVWWGDPKGDMRPDDAESLVFDSPRLEEEFAIVGFPRVHLRVSADAPLAHWVARLEDVQPDGTVSLVTGAILNGSQRDSRLEPRALVPGEVYDIEFELHFTTWTFKRGHRIRLAVSNALFPMIWPSPYLMTTKLILGTESTRLELPVIPAVKRKSPSFVPPEPLGESPVRVRKPLEPGEARTAIPHVQAYFWPEASVEHKRSADGTVSVDWKGANRQEVGSMRLRAFIRDYYETNDKNPANSSYRGERGNRVEIDGRTIDLQTFVDVRSDVENFHMVFLRRIFENERLVWQREWRETIKRDFQ
ncbi:MAG: CocE/NonD family hydrolase, partial [Acidobacteriota bacterium]